MDTKSKNGTRRLVIFLVVVLFSRLLLWFVCLFFGSSLLTFSMSPLFSFAIWTFALWHLWFGRLDDNFYSWLPFLRAVLRSIWSRIWSGLSTSPSFSTPTSSFGVYITAILTIIAVRVTTFIITVTFLLLFFLFFLLWLFLLLLALISYNYYFFLKISWCSLLLDYSIRLSLSPTSSFFFCERSFWINLLWFCNLYKKGL